MSITCLIPNLSVMEGLGEHVGPVSVGAQGFVLLGYLCARSVCVEAMHVGSDQALLTPMTLLDTQ